MNVRRFLSEIVTIFFWGLTMIFKKYLSFEFEGDFRRSKFEGLN